MEKRTIRIAKFFVASSLGFLCFYLAIILVFGSISPLPGLRWSGSSRSCHPPPDSLIPKRINNTQNSSTSDSNSSDDDDLVKLLVGDLRERARKAAASVPGRKIKPTLSADEEAEWKRKNPCRSRTELAPLYSERKYAKDLPPNPLWEEAFREYSNYHRVCMQAVGDVSKYFTTRSTSTGCQFVVADVGMYIGAGNKLQVVSNSVFYGIITRRVILVPTSHLVTSYVCEPFVGSSWKLDSASFPTPPENNRDKWTMSSEFLDSIDKYMASCDDTNGKDDQSASKSTVLAYAAGDTTNQKQPYQRFYCPTEQSFYSEVTWVYLSGCIYTIPKIFAIPTFRPTLEALFPDKVVLTRLFRSIVLPADSVWTRVRRIHDAYLQPAERRVGIQMRYLHGRTQFESMHEQIDRRVEDCLLREKVLPEVDPKSSPSSIIHHGGNLGLSNSTRIKVLVTSLYLRLHDRLTKKYMQNPAAGGESVAVLQLTHEGVQEAGSEVDIQAFAEILLLSLSDNLVLAPISTFGGCAQAYGALTPWFIDYREGEQKRSCERGRSEELCNQYTGKKFDCKYDPALGKKLFSAVTPFIKDCPQIEFPYLSENEQGIHLISTFNS